MVIKKRTLVWDWTNTKDVPPCVKDINWSGPLLSIHNWNSWEPPELNHALPFRPMIRGEGQLVDNEWAMIVNNEHAIIHYFNEPERAGISPERAARLWLDQVVPKLRIEKGKKLVSPSCASDPGGEAWLAEFMRLVGEKGEANANALPDYLGLHYYGGDDGSGAIAYIEKMHARYPGLPVVVSEIASIARDEREVRVFTARVANWMDGVEWVVEYGFFGCMRECADGFVSPQAQLMNRDGTFRELMVKLMGEQPITV
ncbi:hypothetical protein MMC25_004187 [Agyrium rufum]|nr:hypothetical protein [Agyrium rufum]